MKLSVRFIILVAFVMSLFAAGLTSPALAQDCVNAYTVQEGDTLESIAASFEVNVEELTIVNEISDDETIAVGDTLCLDGLAEARPAEENPDADEDGDEGDTDADTDADADTDDDTADTDDTVEVVIPVVINVEPRTDATVTIRDIEYTTDEEGYYTVRGFDRLYNLSFIWGVDQGYLAAVNGIGNPQVVFAGQELLIPMPSYSSEIPGSIPAVALGSRVLRPGDTVMVYGANFRAEEDVELYLTKASADRMSDVIDTVTTDEDGMFEVEITVPETWPNDDSIDFRTASIMARAANDENRFGSLFFLNLDWLDANNR